MHQAKTVAYTASESLAFGAQMHQVQRRLKKLNFNCRWSKKIVDVSQYYFLLKLAVGLVWKKRFYILEKI